jgi:hypothetical protein
MIAAWLLNLMAAACLFAAESSDYPASASSGKSNATQFILFNRAPGQGMNQFAPDTLGRKQFEEVLAHFPNQRGARKPGEC